MKVLLILGNITFNNFEDEEYEMFKKLTERKALVHDIVCIVECDSEEEAGILGEDALGGCCESYLIPVVFEKNGEIAYECSNELLPISVEDFKKDYLD